MAVTIHTTGMHTITRADGSVSSVAFESTRTVEAVPPEVPVPIPPSGAHPDHELPRPPGRPDHTLPEPEQPPEPPALLAGLTVAITLDGVQHVFEEAVGSNLGDYVGPHFTQRCCRVTVPELPGFTVFFRPDADGSRHEVVFELGFIWPEQPAANLGPYTATIYHLDHETGQGTTLATIAVPHHNWFGRWRWQSAPRPIIADVADLIAAGSLPHYDTSAGGGYTLPSTPRVYEGPMSLAGITPGMDGTGEREDIGLVTECQGDYLCTRSDTALASLLAQLEGSGTLTWHYRDENTGAPLDTEQYLQASSYDPNNSDPYIPFQVGDGGGIRLDTAHEPDLFYVPFLLTGDPYALEEIQFAVTFNVISQPPNMRQFFNYAGMLRAHAWSLRATARAACITPDAVPGWLLPRAYFRRMVDANRDWVARDYANNPAAPFSSLSVLADPGWGAPSEGNIPTDCSNTPWWEDFEQAVQGHLIELGFDDWRAIYEWKIRNIVARCDGTSGWHRCQAFPYRIAVRETVQLPYSANWQECWDLNVKLDACDDTLDPDHLPPGTDISYPGYGLGALAIATRLQIPGAAAAHEWLLAELSAKYAANCTLYARWSIA